MDTDRANQSGGWAVLLNLAAFQLCWWTLVLTAAQGPLPGLLLIAGWAAAHVLLIRGGRQDLSLLLLLLALGPLVDISISAAGWLDYRGPAPLPGLPPYWIFGLWAAFALTLRHSMRLPLRHVLLAAVFGAIGGPAAYWAGSRFGAAQFGEPLWLSVAGLAAVWALAMALLSLLTRRLGVSA